MKLRFLALAITTLLCGQMALAQSSTRQILKTNTTPTVIPVWNVHSGQIEALLVIENNAETKGRAWVRASKNSNIIWPNQIANSANQESGMALFCAGQANSFNQLSGLENCQMGNKSNQYPAINSRVWKPKRCYSARLKTLIYQYFQAFQRKNGNYLQLNLIRPMSCHVMD